MRRIIRAFTLIEMIAVILLLSVTMLGISGFLSWATLIYVDSSDRLRMLEESRFIVERLTRELRDSVPNSVRISSDGTCIEFVPIVASGSYTFVPTASADNEVNLIHDDNYTYAVGDDLVIKASSLNDIYNSSQNTRVNSLSYDIATGSGMVASVLTLASNIQFDISFSASPTRANRYYLANDQVSYCVDLSTDEIRRFQYDSITATQADLSSGLNNGVLMAERIINTSDLAEQPFGFADADNNTLELYFKFARDSGAEPMNYYHQIRVKNAG